MTYRSAEPADSTASEPRWSGSTALLVIDVQQGFDRPEWGERNNPACEHNIGLLLSEWRREGWPVVFVRHDSTTPNSPLAPGHPGNAFKAVVTGEPDLLVVKSRNSAFYGTPDLDEWLRSCGIIGVAICGIQTNHCCESTARMASDLGYDVLFVIDATHTFDRPAPDGIKVRARDLARATATSLDGEFARVVTTYDLVSH